MIPQGSGAPVHIKLFGGDGQTYGVAMPMIAYLSAQDHRRDAASTWRRP